MKSEAATKQQTKTRINSPPSPQLDPSELGRLFYALGDVDGNKMKVIHLLVRSSFTVTQMAKQMDLSDSAASQLLSKLKQNGFVDSERGDNRTRIYRIKPDLYLRLKDLIDLVFQN